MYDNYVTHDNYGNEVPIFHFTVFFNHDYGTDHMVIGGHHYPQADTDLNDFANGIRRQGFRNPVVTGWTKEILPHGASGEGQ
ncbi:hypothetical protein [Actinoplanes xinjiangensis]|uniref:hypothetical protein n=1 Tax=Actinoplanes xinjiangensis TaxID=512350 RepID=UPI00343F1643